MVLFAKIFRGVILMSEDPRQKNRRKTERRAKERRVVTHPFNSPEWVKEIESAYLLWPKVDRRMKDRRCEPRRQNHRRTSSISDLELGRALKKGYEILTHEEKQMLNELTKEGDSD